MNVGRFLVFAGNVTVVFVVTTFVVGVLIAAWPAKWMAVKPKEQAESEQLLSEASRHPCR